MRRTSASVRGGSRWKRALGLELGAHPEPVGEVLDVRAKDLLQARCRRRVDAHRHDRLASLGQRRIDGVEDLPGGRLRLRIEALVLGQPALLELCVPQVLGKAVVDLAGEPGPLGQRGVRGVHVAQPAELRVRAAERPVVHAELGDDAHQQDRVEAQSQGICRGDDPGRDDGVEREMELAERGDDEPRRQKTVGDVLVANVQAPIQDRGDDERHEDRDLDDNDAGRDGRQGSHLRPARVEGFRPGHGWQDRFAAEEHDRGQHDADARRQHEEGRPATVAPHVAGCARLR